MTQSQPPHISTLKQDYGFKPGLGSAVPVPSTVHSTVQNSAKTAVQYSTVQNKVQSQYTDCTVQYHSLPISVQSGPSEKLQFGDQHGKIKKEVVTLIKREGKERVILNTGGVITNTEWGGRDTNNNGNSNGLKR